jgi:2-methylcitrate dehydratase PrpD
MMFDNVPPLLPHVRSGRIKALAVTSLGRIPVLPEVPSLHELGLKDFDAVGWNGLLAPAGTPREIVTRLHAETVRVLGNPEVREQLTSQGADIVGNTPEQFAAWIRVEGEEVGRGGTRLRSKSRLSYLKETRGLRLRRAAVRPAADALQRARWLVADSLPVIAAGMQQPELQATRVAPPRRRCNGPAWVLGTRRRAGALDAALLNGTAGTCLELNEGNLYAKGHPGIQVVPAAVALAQETGASGEALLMAVAAGYEVGSRISRAAQVKIAVHPHGTWGTLCAAVAAGAPEGLRRAPHARTHQRRDHHGHGHQPADAARRRDGAQHLHRARRLHGPHGCAAGRVRLHRRARQPASVYGKVLSDSFDPAKVVENLGREWLLGQGYFKLHPTGRYVHSVIDALEDLQSRAGKIDIGKIARIEVKAYRLAAMLSEKRVTSSFGARFSVPFALATILHHGGSGLAQFEQAAVDNPAIQALAARVNVQEDASYTARYPAEQVCELRIVLEGGQVLEGRCTGDQGRALQAAFAASAGGQVPAARRPGLG